MEGLFMSKNGIIGGAVALVVVVGAGGAYAYTHTAKAQFLTHVNKVVKATDNVYQYQLKLSGDEKATITGDAKLDNANREKMAMRVNMAMDGDHASYTVKRDKKHAYVSADLILSMLDKGDFSDTTTLKNQLKGVWMNVPKDAAVDVSALNEKDVRADAQKMTDWFTDLDGKHFTKVDDGYQVTLKKGDLKSFINTLSKTKTAKDVDQDVWRQLKRNLDDGQVNPTVTVTAAKHDHRLSFNMQPDKQNKLTGSITGKEQKDVQVKMPKSSQIKSENELAGLLVQAAFQSAFEDQLGDLDAGDDF